MNDQLDTAGAVDAWLSGGSGNPGFDARINVALSLDSSPDLEAELRAASQRTGVPLDSARAFPDDVRRQAAIEAIDFAGMARDFPSTARFLGSLDNARLAHDDIGALTEMERSIRQMGNVLRPSTGPDATVGTVTKGLAKALPQGAESVRQGLRMQFADLFGFEDMRKDAERKFAASQTKQIISTPQFESDTARGIYGGASSFLRQLPGLAASVLTRSSVPLLATAGAQSEAEAYGKYRARGADAVQAAVGGLGEGAVEVATELLPMSYLVGKFGKAGFGEFMAGMLAREIPSEQVATLLQDAIDTAVANPDKTWAQYRAERPDAAYQTLVSTVTQAGITGAANTVASRVARRDEAAQAAAQDAQALSALSQLAAASKVRQRDAATFEAFIQSAAEDGPVENVFIDAQALLQSGVADQVAQASPSVADQMDAAVQTGGMVRIPLAEYATTLAGQFDQQLLPNLKTSENGFSQAEAAEWMQTSGEAMRAEFERVIKDQTDDATFKAAADTVRETILGQLNTTGRFRNEVHESYAAFASQWYAVTAAKMGITPDALYQQFPLKVVAEDVVGDRLNQGAVETPEFKAWFGESKVVDAEGKPLVVYHGTAADFTRFDLQRGGAVTGAADAREGFFFASNPKAADQFTWKDGDKIGSIMPVYLSLQNPAYSDLVLTGGNGRAAAMQIKDAKAAGHDGMIFRDSDMLDHRGQVLVAFRPEQIKSAIGNRGTFDPNDPNILHQGTDNRGAFSPASNTIALLKGADLTTFLHETAHFFLEVQADIAGRTDAPAAIQQDMQTLLDWFGVKDMAEWQNLGFEEKRSYHEKFAEGFEKYLFEGRAPSIELQGMFQRFRAWMLNVYKTLKAMRVDLTDEVRGVMDRMLATTEQIKTAEMARSMMPLFQTAEDAAKVGLDAAEFRALHDQAMEATQTAISELETRGLRDMKWLAGARGRELKRLQREAKAQRAEVQIEARREVMSQPVYRAWQFLTGKLDKTDRIAPQAVSKSDPNVVDDTQDTLFAAIAKLGGMNKAEVVGTWGIDEADAPQSGVFGKPVWRLNGGLSIDGMAELLAQYGYLPLDESGRYDLADFKEKFATSAAGTDVYSQNVDYSRFADPGKAGEGVDVERLGAGRIDRGALVDLYGKAHPIIEHLEALRMLAKNGLHPDFVAEQFGFSSGDEMARTLAVAEKPGVAVEALTDQMMLEKHADLATPEALEQAADQAVHNAARARFVTTEYNALARATGRRKIIAKGARQFARDTIARQRVRDLKPGQYGTSEAKAARAAEKAMKAGDIATAAAEKRNQVINAHLARATHDAKAEVLAGVEYLRRFEKASIRKGIDADYGDQIDALLDRFDLRRGLPLKAIDKRKGLVEWVEAQRAQGLEPDLPPGLLDEARRQSYKDMTVEEFRGLVDAVKQIEHLGSLKRKLLTARDQKDYETARDLIVASINDNAGSREAVTRSPATRGGRAAKALREFGAAHIKAAAMVRIMDGGKDGGPMWEYLIRTANERADMETVMRQQATAALHAILKPVFALGKMEGKGTFFPTLGTSLNREQRIAVALNAGNAGNLQRLLGGENWSRGAIEPVLQSLTASEWLAVQQVWDFFESYRPQIAEKERRVYGIEPEWISPQTLTVTTADGQALTLRGGYYPIKYDPAASLAAEEHDDAEAAKQMMQAGYTSATTRRSFTKARAEEVKNRPLLYSLSGLYSGVNEVIHDLAWHEWLIDANKLMRSHAIDDAIRTKYGPEWKKELKRWTEDIARGDSQASHQLEGFIGRLRHGVSIAGLGFNVMTAAIQPLGFTQSIVRIGPKYALRGLAKFMASLFDMAKEVNAKSVFMEERARTRFRELNEIRNQVQGKTAAMQKIERHSYTLMLATQRLVDLPTWWGAYEKAMAEGNDEARSVALADQAVKDSQGSGMLMDQAGIERGNKFVKLFTTFYTFMNTALNLGVERTMQAHTPGQRARLAVDYLLLYALPPAMTVMLKAALTPGDDGDDPEKLAKKLAAEQVNFAMGLFVGVREFQNLSSLVTGKPNDYAGPSGLRVIPDTIKFGQQAAQGEFDTAFRKAAINLAGSLFGLPAAQINRSWTGAEALSEGKTDNLAAAVLGYQEPR